MPILKQLVSNSAHSKRRSRADLTAEMISAPLGDFRHTMHTLNSTPFPFPTGCGQIPLCSSLMSLQGLGEPVKQEDRCRGVSFCYSEVTVGEGETWV
uniref:CRIB domain-containing protein n=1 Tax=Gopherus evgoodei TaxID=1825980 RepID=A0A8C4W0Q2_9SAUR